MLKYVVLGAIVALGLGISPALAEKKQLAIVLGGLDNPFFQQIAAGCAKWNAQHADSGYECVATGPEKSSDQADELKLIETALGTAAGVALAPATPGIPDLLTSLKPTVPVVTLSGDFPPESAALRSAWIGSDEYEVGVALANLVLASKPDGGTICLQLNTEQAMNINKRAAGTRDTLAGAKGTERLTGQNGWTEVKGCPVYAADNPGTANKQLTKVLSANPKIDVIVLEGGWAMFDPKGFTKVIGKKVKARIDKGELVIVAADALPPQMDALKAGRVTGLIAQLPTQFGLMAPDVLIGLIEGKPVAERNPGPLAVCTKDTADTCLAD